MLDAVDLQILNLIQANARVAQAEMARAVGLAPSAVLERLRKLEAKGILRGYAALVDPAAVELGQLSFVAVRAKGTVTDTVGHALAGIPEVLEVHNVAGDDCYLLKVRARDAQHVGQLLRQMQTIDGVISTRTTIVLDTFKETPRLPLPTPPGTSASTPAAASSAPSADGQSSTTTEENVA
jgi:Lrp/AsnC family transcriptional regulator, leucine-responsive regulatory protein